MDERRFNFNTLVTLLFALTLIFAIVANFYRYMIRQENLYIVEASCNPSVETCYYRDCDDYCPPNGLGYYKSYTIEAKDFPKCEEGNCDNACKTGLIECESIMCGEGEEDECVSPESYEPPEEKTIEKSDIQLSTGSE